MILNRDVLIAKLVQLQDAISRERFGWAKDLLPPAATPPPGRR